MRGSGLHLTSSRLMHHTYEVMEVKGWIQRECSPQCKVLPETLHCYILEEAAHTAMSECSMSEPLFKIIRFAYNVNGVDIVLCQYAFIELNTFS